MNRSHNHRLYRIIGDRQQSSKYPKVSSTYGGPDRSVDEFVAYLATRDIAGDLHPAKGLDGDLPDF
ncbi:MAG: hypothetical protein AB7R77_12745 [Ilumatobacteraceae bacterium]